MKLHFDTNSIDSYRQFLAVKTLPSYTISGRVAEFPDEYASRIGMAPPAKAEVDYAPSEFLFDYQRDISKLAIEKRKYCVFADCGLGKSLIIAEFIRAASQSLGSSKGVLLVVPLMVVHQMIAEFSKFYGDGLPIEKVTASELPEWLESCGGKVGITNYEAIREGLTRGQLGGLVIDESSLLKSMYGKWGTRLIELGKGLEWKLACTGTPTSSRPHADCRCRESRTGSKRSIFTVLTAW